MWKTQIKKLESKLKVLIFKMNLKSLNKTIKKKIN